MAEGRKRRFAKRVANGTIGNCYNCGDPDHIFRNCPNLRGGGVRGGGRGGGQGERGRGCGNQGGPPQGCGNELGAAGNAAEEEEDDEGEFQE
ncbi:hypothetical protein JBE27_57455, partial [Streptomyces albiflaviniger]|nr:hypothetical protein [Streptomyces albiflaviniger]